jgi:hypothetical protein
MLNFILGLATGVLITLAAVQQDYVTVISLLVLSILYPFLDKELN